MLGCILLINSNIVREKYGYFSDKLSILLGKFEFNSERLLSNNLLKNILSFL